MGEATPGPWEWDCSRMKCDDEPHVLWSVREDGRKTIVLSAETRCYGYERSDEFIEISKEDMSLIAAAPLLLAACEAVEGMIERLTKEKVSSIGIDPYKMFAAYVQLAAAIKAAKGVG